MTTYILTEQIMNGTVTMKTITTLVEAETFDGAKDKLRNRITTNPLTINHSVDEDSVDRFSFTIPGAELYVHGRMTSAPAQLLGESGEETPQKEENIGERTNRLRQERYEGLFWVLRAQVLASGGDGDGLVVSPEYKKLADMFQEYESQDGRKHFTERGDEDGISRFCAVDDQDCVTFCSPERSQAMASWAGCDILVKVPYV